MSLVLAILVALVVFAILEDTVYFLFFAGLLMTTVLFLKFEAKFEKVDARFERIDAGLTAVEGKLERFDVRIIEIDRKVDALIEKRARKAPPVPES